MKRFLPILFSILIATNSWAMIHWWYNGSGLTGGTAEQDLDAVDGQDLTDSDKAVIITSDEFSYFYDLDYTSAAAESSPMVIKPDTNAGDKRWALGAIAWPRTPQTLADEATPSVSSGQSFVTSGTTNDPITDFDDGITGQTIKLSSAHKITITDGTNIFLDGSANFEMCKKDSLSLIQKADTYWYELSRAVRVIGFSKACSTPFDTPSGSPFGIAVTPAGDLVSYDSGTERVYYHEGLSDTVNDNWASDATLYDMAILTFNGRSDLYVSHVVSGDDQYISRYEGISSSRQWVQNLGNTVEIGGIAIWQDKLYVVDGRNAESNGYDILRYDIVNAENGGDSLVYEDKVAGLGTYNVSLYVYSLAFDLDGNLMELNLNDREIFRRSGWNGAQIDSLDVSGLSFGLGGLAYANFGCDEVMVLPDFIGDDVRVYTGFTTSESCP